MNEEMSIEEIMKELKYSLSEAGQAEASRAAHGRESDRYRMTKNIIEFVEEKNGVAVATIIRGLFRNIESRHQDGLAGEVLSSLCAIYDLSIYEIHEAAYSKDPPGDLLNLFS